MTTKKLLLNLLHSCKNEYELLELLDDLSSPKAVKLILKHVEAFVECAEGNHNPPQGKKYFTRYNQTTKVKPFFTKLLKSDRYDVAKN